MEVKDLDICTNEEEVLRSFGVHEVSVSSTQVINIRETYGQTQVALVIAGAEEAEKILSKNRIRLGLVNCRVRKIERRVLCYRYTRNVITKDISITEEDLRYLGSELPINNAPGPDGVPDIIVMIIIDRRPELLTKFHNDCLKKGFLQKQWKIANLLLLRKGNKPLENLSSYRPICLLNTGKHLKAPVCYIRENNA